MSDFRQDFIRFALKKQVLRFGSFVTKAGRTSPYFFNAGLFNDGESTLHLPRFYAKSISESGVAFDMIFGPAYKGIILGWAFYSEKCWEFLFGTVTEKPFRLLWTLAVFPGAVLSLDFAWLVTDIS